MPPYTVKCSGNGCDARYTRHDCADIATFSNEAGNVGWEYDPDNKWTCPSCLFAQEQPNPILAIPISCGTFYADCPAGMTAEDWRAVADCVERVAQIKGGGSE